MKRIILTAILTALSLNGADTPSRSMSGSFGKPTYTPTYVKPTPKAYRFGFKDGSVFYGKIYKGDSLARGASAKGLVLETMDNKIYVHHYPAKVINHPIMGTVVENGRGGYDPYTPEPPVEEIIPDRNPIRIPVCSPVRISFMQFDKPTLNGLYNYYSGKTRTEYNKGYTVSSNANKIIAKEIYKAYNSKTPASKRNTSAKSLAWKRKIFKEFAGTKNVIWGEHYARRR